LALIKLACNVGQWQANANVVAMPMAMPMQWHNACRGNEGLAINANVFDTVSNVLLLECK